MNAENIPEIDPPLSVNVARQVIGWHGVSEKILRLIHNIDDGKEYLAFYDGIAGQDWHAWGARKDENGKYSMGAANTPEGGIPLTPEWREWVLRWMRCLHWHYSESGYKFHDEVTGLAEKREDEDGEFIHYYDYFPDYVKEDIEAAFKNPQHCPRSFGDATAESWDAEPKRKRAPLCQWCGISMADCRCHDCEED